MTTQKEEAINLVKKYVDLFKKSDTCFGDCNNTVACQQSWYQCEEWYRQAIQCALINVDEILDKNNNLCISLGQYNDWSQVKQEIEKL